MLDMKSIGKNASKFKERKVVYQNKSLSQYPETSYSNTTNGRDGFFNDKNFEKINEEKLKMLMSSSRSPQSIANETNLNILADGTNYSRNSLESGPESPQPYTAEQSQP